MLLAEALHRRLHSAFEKPFLLLLGKSVVIVHFCSPNIFVEEAKQGEEGAAERTGEYLCHLSGYNNETARAVSLMNRDFRFRKSLSCSFHSQGKIHESYLCMLDSGVQFQIRI